MTRLAEHVAQVLAVFALCSLGCLAMAAILTLGLEQVTQ